MSVWPYFFVVVVYSEKPIQHWRCTLLLFYADKIIYHNAGNCPFALGNKQVLDEVWVFAEDYQMMMIMIMMLMINVYLCARYIDRTYFFHLQGQLCMISYFHKLVLSVNSYCILCVYIPVLIYYTVCFSLQPLVSNQMEPIQL